jgi:hypothetical protein
MILGMRERGGFCRSGASEWQSVRDRLSKPEMWRKYAQGSLGCFYSGGKALDRLCQFPNGGGRALLTR